MPKTSKVIEKKTSYRQRPDRRALVLIGLVVLLFLAVLFSVVRSSLVIGRGGRFNLVAVDNHENALFVSYDATQERITVVSFPSELFIRSRSVGEYQIGKLYQLAQYEEDPGIFVRRKIQGFMRVPVPGYIVADGDLGESARKGLFSTLLRRIFSTPESNITRLDALTLLIRGQSYIWDIQDAEFLVREGVLVSRNQGGYGYNPARLLEYVDGKFFDWLVGQEPYSVSIIDLSNERGLASDLSDFVTNMGSDVVMVKKGDETSSTSRMVVSSEEVLDSYTTKAIRSLLGIENIVIGDTSVYRSDIVLFVGSDMENIF